jgi:hypothetical protein
VVARSKAWVCGRSLTGIVGSNPAGAMDACLLLSAVFCQVEGSASRWSLVQRSPTYSGVSECDYESSKMRKPWPTGGCCDVLKNVINILQLFTLLSPFCLLFPFPSPRFLWLVCPTPERFSVKLFICIPKYILSVLEPRNFHSCYRHGFYRSFDQQKNQVGK